MQPGLRVLFADADHRGPLSSAQAAPRVQRARCASHPRRLCRPCAHLCSPSRHPPPCQRQIKLLAASSFGRPLAAAGLGQPRPSGTYVWLAGLTGRFSTQAFIDAAHDYTNVHQDVLAFWSKVKPNGVLAGHDFNHHRNWAGILEKRLAYARSPAGSKRGKRIPPSYGVGQALSRSLTLSLTLTPTPTPTLTALLRIGAGVGRALLPLRVPRQLRRVVSSYVETRRPEASANAPPSTPRPRQIELGAASSRGPPPPIGRYIHWLATPAFFFT